VLIVCAIFLRSNEGISTLSRTLSDLAGNFSDLRRLHLALDILASLPDEIESLDVSRSLKLEIESQMLQLGPWTINLVDSIATAITDTSVLVATIKVIRAWLPQGFNLCTLYKDHKPAFGLVCSGLQATDSSILMESVGLTRELFTNTEYPRDSCRNDAVRTIISYLTSSNASWVSQYFFGGNQSDERRYTVAVEIVHAFTCIASQEIQLLCGNDGASVGEPFFHMIICCISNTPRNLAFLTFDFWIELHQDMPPVDRAAHLSTQVLPALLNILINHCMYSHKYIQTLASGELNDDMDDFDNFRDTRLGIQELFQLCHVSIGAVYFRTLTSLLIVYMTDPALQWMKLEIVLFAVRCSMESLKSAIDDCEEGISEVEQEAVNFLFNLTVYLVSNPLTSFVSAGLFVVVNSICSYLSAITFLVTSNSIAARLEADGAVASAYCSVGQHQGAFLWVPFKTLFYQCISLSFDCISSPSAPTSKAASKAFYQLSIHGSKWLLLSATDSADTSEGVLSVRRWLAATAGFVREVQSVESSAVLLQLLEALTRCVLAMKQRCELQEELVMTIAAPIASGISSQVAGAMTNQQAATAIAPSNISAPLPQSYADKLAALLACASQVIRFSDTIASSNSPEPHLALPFVGMLWPSLRAISSTTMFLNSESISTLVFEIYGRIFSSIGASAFAELEYLSNFIVSVVRFKAYGMAGALRCGSVIVEIVSIFCVKSSDIELKSQLHAHLAALLQNVVGALLSAVRAVETQQHVQPAVGPAEELTIAFGPDDAGVIEAFATFVHKYIVMCAGVFVQSDTIESVLHLWCYCFQRCAEKDPMRSLLQLLQYLFSPMGSRRDPQVDALILRACMPFGARTVFLLVASMNDHRIASLLVPNITEALYSVIVAAGDHGRSEYTVECQRWFRAVIFDASCLQQLPTSEYRGTLFELMFTLAHESNRRFRSLMQDLFKICSNELTIDCLLAYSDTGFE
jgi:hypothetical protein